MRYNGKLKKWEEQRGFGFIVADDGGQDVFVHISAFRRDGRLPVEGELLSFEVEPDRNGKRSAVRVQRPVDVKPIPVSAGRRGAWRPATIHGKSGFSGKLVILAALVALGWYAYSRYANRVVQIKAAAQTTAPLPAPVVLFEAAQTAHATFTCDGRKHCSQMTSCKEAKLFLKNCLGMEMDGNHDGVPCEQQWCTSPFAD